MREDAVELQAVMGADPTPGVLEDVDRAVRQERPVLAAQLLQRGGIPAARRQTAAARGADVSTKKGRELRRALSRAYAMRADALVSYARALERGVMYDDALVAALRAQREANEAILAVDTQLEQVRPLRKTGGARAPAGRLEHRFI